MSRPAGGPGSGGRRAPFGVTWWGRAWVEALEGSASLDPSRLSRGRRYARDGSVRDVVVGPGYVAATVRGNHGRLYRADVGVRTLARTEWEQVAEAIAAKAAHAAALLDGELDPGLVDDAAAVDVRLLPGPGDLRPDCSCPDWAEPCKHAAALCYAVADELDRDPFQLFLLRGIERDELLAMVRELRSGAEGGAVEVEAEGVDGVEAWAGRGWEVDLGSVPEAAVGAMAAWRRGGAGTEVGTRGRGSRFEGALDEDSGLSERRIDALAEDAADRAWGMLADGAPSGLAAEERGDLARRAAWEPDRRVVARWASRAGVGTEELEAWAQAWRIGGEAAVEVVSDESSWTSEPEVLAAARDRLVELGIPRRSIGLGWNALRLSGGVWIVQGSDARWWRLVEGERAVRTLDGEGVEDVGDLVAAW